MSVTNKLTGEVFEVKNITEAVNVWKDISSQIKALEAVKEQMKSLLPKYLNEQGKSEEVDGYYFNSMIVQRRNYNKAVMREVLDEDTFDLFLKPDKTAIDKYLKENAEEIGDASTQLRNTMVDEGRAYTVTKLEKIK